MILPSVTIVCSSVHPMWCSEGIEAAMQRGTEVHEACHERAVYDADLWTPIAAHDKYIEAFQEWKSIYRPVFTAELCEARFKDEAIGYHGQPDLIATIGKQTGVIDIKSGSAPPYTDLQCAAYRRGLVATWGKIDFAAWLILLPSGRFKYHVMSAIEEATAAADFYAALRIYRRVNKGKLNGGTK